MTTYIVSVSLLCCFVLRQLLGKRESIAAYTGNTGFIGSPCVDALVDDGTVLEALTFDTVCQMDIVDNAALANASVEVCVYALCNVAWHILVYMYTRHAVYVVSVLLCSSDRRIFRCKSVV